MRKFKYVMLAMLVVFALASATVTFAQGGTPPSGTPPSGTPPAGQPPQGQGGPGQGPQGQGQGTQGQPPQGQPPQGPGPQGGLEGVVKTVSSSSLTVLDAKSETVTATISSTTQITLMVSQSTGTVSDIVVGDNVSIQGPKASDGTVSAVQITVEPAGTKVSGMVSAVSGTTITVKDWGTQTTISTASATFMKGKDTSSLSDVSTGKFVTAYGTKQSDGSLTATYVFISDGPGAPGQGQPPQGPPPQDQGSQGK